MFDYLNHNAGAMSALATLALLLVTGWYAWTTRAMLKEAKQSRLLANQPRVVAYLRAHEVHGNIVQLCIANLSGAAAISVSASVEKVTEWPERFDLQDSKILRDLSFMRGHEVLRFDLGFGPDLFRNEVPAIFKAAISYTSLDGRRFTHEFTLAVESVTGHAHWQIYGVDDVARRLKDIADTLSGFAGFKRLKVETYTAADRQEESRAREEQRQRFIREQAAAKAPSPSQEPAASAKPRRSRTKK
jgi:hypothetical protein